jgi:hypothetical protein
MLHREKKKPCISNKNYYHQNSNLKYYSVPYAFQSDEAYLWILKPNNSRNGNGVFLFNNLKNLEELLANFYSGWNAQTFASLPVLA